MYITPEQNWKRKTRLAFILFCFVSLGFLAGIAMKIRFLMQDDSVSGAKRLPDRDITSVTVIWVLSLIVWLGFRRYYRLMKKNNKDSLSGN